MTDDKRTPTMTFDSYWIFALNPSYTFSKPKEERLSGKWLIFEHMSSIDQTWNLIQDATLKGKLGPSSKVSTAKENPNAQNHEFGVICVFTEDFHCKKDVERVKDAIRSLGIENKLAYKLDKDVGKYAKSGDQNLSQLIDYAPKYYEAIHWLKNQKENPLIIEKEDTKNGKSYFEIHKGNQAIQTFKERIIQLAKLGCYVKFEVSNPPHSYIVYESR